MKKIHHYFGVKEINKIINEFEQLELFDKKITIFETDGITNLIFHLNKSEIKFKLNEKIKK